MSESTILVSSSGAETAAGNPLWVGSLLGNEHRFDPLSERGSTGLRQAGGFVFDDPLQILQGLRGVKIWREMADSDPTIGSMLFLVKQQMRRIPLNVEAAEMPEDDPRRQAAEDAADWLRDVLDDMETTLNDIKAEASSCLEYGFAPMEVTYKWRHGPEGKIASQSEDGRLGVHKIALRSQDSILRWDIADSGDLLGLWQQPYTGGRTIYIPREKFLLFRTTSLKGNPEGRSILRNCYGAWLKKKKMEIVEAIGVERDLAGYPVVRIPNKLITDAANGDARSAAAYNAYKTIVGSIRRDDREGLVLPSDMRPADQGGGYLYDLQLLTSGSRRNFDTGAISTRYSQEMAMTLMVDFILLGHGSHGTQALASTKVDLFLDSIQGYMDMLADTLTRQLVGKLWELNGFDRGIMPVIKPDQANPVDPVQLAQLITSFTAAGMPIFPDPTTEAWVREQVGLPPESPEAAAARQAMSMMDPTGGLDPVDLSGSNMDPAANGAPGGQPGMMPNSPSGLRNLAARGMPKPGQGLNPQQARGQGLAAPSPFAGRGGTSGVRMPSLFGR